MKPSNFAKLILLLPTLALATGCASVTRGSSDALEVSSTPNQADVKIYRTNAGLTAKEIQENTIADPDNPGGGPILGTTPGTFMLARKGEYKVVISKQGFKTVEVEVGNRLSGAGGAGMAGNLLVGGIVGMVVDSRTGATRDLTPNPIAVDLEEGNGTVSILLEKEEGQTEEVEKEKTAEEPTSKE